MVAPQGELHESSGERGVRSRVVGVGKRKTDMSGQTIFILGASRGIGRAVAIACAPAAKSPPARKSPN